MKYYIGSMPVGDDDLEHFGIKGMKWGRRNYQNADGSLTAAGRMRYGYNRARRGAARQYRNAKRWGNRQVRNAKRYYNKNRDAIGRAARIAGATAGTLGAVYLGQRYGGSLYRAGAKAARGIGRGVRRIAGSNAVRTARLRGRMLRNEVIGRADNAFASAKRTGRRIANSNAVRNAKLRGRMLGNEVRGVVDNVYGATSKRLKRAGRAISNSKVGRASSRAAGKVTGSKAYKGLVNAGKTAGLRGKMAFYEGVGRADNALQSARRKARSIANSNIVRNAKLRGRMLGNEVRGVADNVSGAAKRTGKKIGNRVSTHIRNEASRGRANRELRGSLRKAKRYIVRQNRSQARTYARNRSNRRRIERSARRNMKWLV